MTTATPSATTDPTAVFHALSDDTRLRCLVLIALHGELCVCEIVHALELSQPKISRHLKLLRDTVLVADRRDGTWVHYRLAPDMPGWVRRTLDVLVEAQASDAPFANDARRLARMADRPGGRCADALGNAR